MVIRRIGLRFRRWRSRLSACFGMLFRLSFNAYSALPVPSKGRSCLPRSIARMSASDRLLPNRSSPASLTSVDDAVALQCINCEMSLNPCQQAELCSPVNTR